MVDRPTQYDALKQNSKLRPVYQWVHSHFDDRLSLSDAASLACLEEHYFSVYFHSRVGISFSEWQRQVRVERAKALLAFTNSSVSEIANDVGYSDLTSFGRLFRRTCGMSASQYRKRKRESS